MPSCRPDIMSEVVYKVIEMKPNTILDIGVGYGKWGVLCDEYLRYWCNIKPTIDGIEVFEDYKSPAHGVYNKIIYDNVMNQLSTVSGYDLVLIIDVIEHLSREDGLKLLDCIKGHYIISTPNYWHPQASSFGNEHEKHISLWTQKDFVQSCLVRNKVGRDHIVGWK